MALLPNTVRGYRQFSPAQPVERKPNMQLLAEMAVYFTVLETLPQWPPQVREHCEAWAALMGMELPAQEPHS